MSTRASIANFAVDLNGNEVPIEYKAEDLVNVIAPEGYVWQRRTHEDDEKIKFYAGYDDEFATRKKWHDEVVIDDTSEASLWFQRTEPIYRPDPDWQEYRMNVLKSTYYTTPYYIAVRL